MGVVVVTMMVDVSLIVYVLKLLLSLGVHG